MYRWVDWGVDLQTDRWIDRKIANLHIPLSNSSEPMSGGNQTSARVCVSWLLSHLYHSVILNMSRYHTHCSQGRNIFLCQCLSKFNYASLKAKVNETVRRNMFLITEVHLNTTLQHVAHFGPCNDSKFNYLRCVSWHLITIVACFTQKQKASTNHWASRRLKFRSYLPDNILIKPPQTHTETLRLHMSRSVFYEDRTRNSHYAKYSLEFSFSNSPLN